MHVNVETTMSRIIVSSEQTSRLPACKSWKLVYSGDL